MWMRTSYGSRSKTLRSSQLISMFIALVVSACGWLVLLLALITEYQSKSRGLDRKWFRSYRHEGGADIFLRVPLG